MLDSGYECGWKRHIIPSPSGGCRGGYKAKAKAKAKAAAFSVLAMRLTSACLGFMERRDAFVFRFRQAVQAGHRSMREEFTPSGRFMMNGILRVPASRKMYALTG